MKNKIIYYIGGGILILFISYVIYINFRIDNIAKKYINSELEKTEILTPFIKDQENNLIITKNVIIEQEKKIDVIKESMKDLKVDTLNLEDAIEIIKNRAEFYEKAINSNNNIDN